MMNTLIERPTRRLMQIGAIVFAVYLVAVTLDAALTIREIQAWLPEQYASGASLGFFLAISGTVIGELTMLGLGALLVAAMVTLVDGEPDARRLVAIVACCYAPLLVYFGAVLVMILGGAVDASRLANAANGREMIAQVRGLVPDALAPLAPLRYLCMIAALAMGWSALRAACRLTASRAAVVVAMYALFNVAVASFRPA